MLHSMTGFGKATGTFNDKNFNVEIRSLNSKQADINLRLPSAYKQNEMELRKLLIDKLVRGKVSLTIEVEENTSKGNYCIDTALAKKYYKDIETLREETGLSDENILSTLLRLPEVMVQENQEEDAEAEAKEWEYIMQLVNRSVDNLIAFRKSEGGKLMSDLSRSVDQIGELLTKVEPFEKQRMINIKERLEKNLAEWIENDKVDRNRLEQELIYYIEKFDINEEKVRLRAHCAYFLETMNEGSPNGKKLGFISQEMGREINTLGSKANDAAIQRIVVQMKDELEKIKEQTLNIL